MTAREAAIAAVLAEHSLDLHEFVSTIGVCCCGDWRYGTVRKDAVEDAHRAHRAAAIVAALDTTTATETGTYPCCDECWSDCSGRHESRCHCQTAELLAIADEGAARARGEGL